MNSSSLFFAFFFFLFSTSAADKPNILLIFTDDQGWNDVGCYGSEIPTPNIDRIAEEGIRFTQFYSASSICTPSRFGLLTGQNPIRSEDQLLSALMFMADEHSETGIQEHETTIAEVLRDKGGYETGLIGKWHLGHGKEDLLPMNHGFDTFIGHTGGCIDFFTMTYGIIPDWYNGSQHVTENGYATELITKEAVEWLSHAAASEKPFFLYLAYNAPHFGKGYSPSDQKPVNLMQPQAADLKRVEFIEDKIRREFAAMTTSLDDGVGKVLDALDKNRLTKNTLVIFLTDHGGDPTYGGSNKPLR
ncbi:MAG: sulfatase-like hydrolase/transferase, partial [Verrucomicrobiales bacterium]|nr:sulfatase-like hydrolase/transferase [Verrucomicrobiales bacterium]